MEYIRETVTEEIIGGKKVKVTVRANRPSQEAMRRFAQTYIRIMNEMEKEKESRE